MLYVISVLIYSAIIIIIEINKHKQHRHMNKMLHLVEVSSSDDDPFTIKTAGKLLPSDGCLTICIGPMEAEALCKCIYFL